ncbi:MAG: hypothetical protein PSX81_14600 [bacterium]|nr:hypothetical protein [bacterium]
MKHCYLFILIIGICHSSGAQIDTFHQNNWRRSLLDTLSSLSPNQRDSFKRYLLNTEIKVNYKLFTINKHKLITNTKSLHPLILETKEIFLEVLDHQGNQLCKQSLNINLSNECLLPANYMNGMLIIFFTWGDSKSNLNSLILSSQ